MAFPTTGILDNFNSDVNGASPPNASFTNFISGGLKVSGSAAIGNTTNTDNISGWNVAKFGPNSECYCDITTLPTSSGAINIYVRMASLTSTTNGYGVVYTPGTGVTFVRFDTGTPTAIGSTIVVTFSAADSFGCQMIGSVLTAYRKTSGAWTNLGSVTDATYSASGYIGWDIHDTGGTTKIDNCGGGTAGNWLIEGFRWDNPYVGRNQ